MGGRRAQWEPVDLELQVIATFKVVESSGLDLDMVYVESATRWQETMPAWAKQGRPEICATILRLAEPYRFRWEEFSARRPTGRCRRTNASVAALPLAFTAERR